MPNPIKYTTGSETLALKKGNFYMGTGDVGKGPSEATGYYQGVSPSAGGYVIYMNKSGAPGDLSYHNAANDSELISFTNNLAETSFTSATQCLVYYASQTDKVVLNRDYEGIVTDGLVLNLDAGFTPSYPRSGTTWGDISLSGNNGTLINGPTFSGDSIVLDGTNDYISVNRSIVLEPTSVTMQCVFYIGTWFNYPGIMAKGYWGSPENEGYSMHIRDNYDLWVDFNNNGSRIILGPFGKNVGITQNSLNFVTVTIGPNGANIYNKGVNYYSDTTNYTIVYTGGSTPADLWIGWMHYRGGTLNGRIYTASIYNRALSETEVLQNWNVLKGRFGL